MERRRWELTGRGRHIKLGVQEEALRQDQGKAETYSLQFLVGVAAFL
jgi:hypothetical protein